MKIILLLISISYSLTLAGQKQKVFIDEYKASIVDSSEAQQFAIIDYGNNTNAFKETYYYITGEKKSETNFIKSTGLYEHILSGTLVKILENL